MDKVKTIENDELYLRQISKKVDLNDINLKNDIKILSKFCKENSVLAMASIQLGICKRIIYLKNTNIERINKAQYNKGVDIDNNYDEAKILINPVIIKKEGLTTYWEACASCLDNMGLVQRPYKIEIEYINEDLEKQKQIFEGFEATVLSHEYDHLDGILHIDIALELKNMIAEERAIFRQTHGYKIISKEGNYEDLINVKRLNKKI